MKPGSRAQKSNATKKRPRGRPANPENANRRPLLVRLPNELYEDLQHLAVARDLFMGDIVVEVLKTWLAKQPERRALELLRKASG